MAAVEHPSEHQREGHRESRVMLHGSHELSAIGCWAGCLLVASGQSNGIERTYRGNVRHARENYQTVCASWSSSVTEVNQAQVAPAWKPNKLKFIISAETAHQKISQKRSRSLFNNTAYSEALFGQTLSSTSRSTNTVL